MKLFVNEMKYAGGWITLNLVEGCFHSTRKLLCNYVESRGYAIDNFRIRRVSSQKEKDQYTRRGVTIVPLMRTE